MRTTIIALLLLTITFVMSEKLTLDLRGKSGGFETISTKVKDQVEITLFENPTTGYQWIIPELQEGFNWIWSLQNDLYVQDNSNGNMVGVGGTRTFLLDINKAGNEHFTLVYGHPWLYDQTIEDFYKTGRFDASIMEGYAIQVGIDARISR